MAINKIEGIFSDVVVIFDGGNWYGIPFLQLVQIQCVQDHFGLTVTRLTLQDDDITGSTCDPTEEEIVADRVVLLRNRFMSVDGLDEVRDLLHRFPGEFTDVLSSCLIP